MVIEEMENIEKDFYATYEIVLSYLDSRANDTSSDSSALRSINDERQNEEDGNMEKRFKLCFRCLADGHEGKACRNTRRCGKDGCHKVHHRLLHVETGKCRIKVSELKSDTEPKLKLNNEPPQERQGPEATSACYLTFGMEGKKFTEQSYFYDSPIKDENMNACFNSGVTDNEGTRAAMLSNTINNFNTIIKRTQINQKRLRTEKAHRFYGGEPVPPSRKKLLNSRHIVGLRNTSFK